MYLQYFLNLTLLDQILILYFLSINIFSFFFFGWDKLQSRFKARRVSEKSLWFITLIGGSIGSLFGMQFFRHKTKKISFQAGIAIILALQILVVYYVLS